ncbi:MAG: SGNH/GDSL hydrolase family protein [Candidatus Thorarchaeota archaeon]
MITIALVVLIAASTLFPVYVLWQMNRLPPNNPRKLKHVLKQSEKKTLVFLGDSITHGRVSANYVEIISRNQRMESYNIVNAGVNGDLAWNVLNRLDDTVSLKPDIIILMIGTNDAMGSLSKKDARIHRYQKKLPRNPTVKWYAENLDSIVKKLVEETSAQLAIISIPPLGEEIAHRAYERSQDIAEVSKHIAEAYNIAYLPANEVMSEYILNNPSHPTSRFESRLRIMFQASFRHYIFGKSWDRISAESGFNLLIDHVHLNTKGAAIVAKLITDFLEL